MNRNDFDKYLFLDIDGVIVNDFDLRQEYNLGFDKMLFSWYLMNPTCLKYLEEIVVKTNCKIVISSSWRNSFTLKELQDLFEQNNFKYSESVIGVTPNCYTFVKPEYYTPRGCEIQHWLKLNAPQQSNIKYKYCIVDDIPDMLLEQKNNFVQTVFEKGITNIEKNLIINILK